MSATVLTVKDWEKSYLGKAELMPAWLHFSAQTGGKDYILEKLMEMHDTLELHPEFHTTKASDYSPNAEIDIVDFAKKVALGSDVIQDLRPHQNYLLRKKSEVEQESFYKLLAWLVTAVGGLNLLCVVFTPMGIPWPVIGVASYSLGPVESLLMFTSGLYFILRIRRM